MLDAAPGRGPLTLKVRRGSATEDLTLELPKHWRRRDQFAWRYSFNALKSKLLGFDELMDLDDKTRRSRGIQADESAISIGRVLRARRGSGFNARARAAGLRSKDVILSVDDQGRHSQSEMLAYVLQHKQPGDQVRFKVLRNSERLEFSFPVQRIQNKRGHDH